MLKIKKNFNKKNIIFLLFLLILIAKVILVFNIYISSDEPFTMSLISHKFSNLIPIDSLDVHPPLYYFLLKFFIILFTFWTKSLLIKILCAKIFSLLSYVIGMIYLLRLLKLINVKINNKIVVIAYLLIPNVITYVFQIRMYELVFMFLSIEFYELIKFDKTNKNVNLISAIILASLASYTHYFGALSAGALLISFFIIYIVKHNIKNMLKMLMSGILFLILFLPCIILAYKQIIYVTSRNFVNLTSTGLGNNFFVQLVESLTGFTTISSPLKLILSISILLLGFLFVYYSMKYLSKQFNSTLVILIITVIICGGVPYILSLIMGHSLFQARYLYPITSIYNFFLIVIFIKMLSIRYKFKKMLIGFLVIVCIIINITGIKRIYASDTETDHAYHIARYWSHNKHKIFVNCGNSYNKTDLYLKAAVYSRYSSYHPNIYIKNMIVSQILSSNNRHLMHRNFTNIYLNGPSK